MWADKPVGSCWVGRDAALELSFEKARRGDRVPAPNKLLKRKINLLGKRKKATLPGKKNHELSWYFVNKRL